MDYLFTVIIPIYNSERFLPECIESILIQGHKSTEILLINDCSTDKSGKICYKYSQKYDFIHVINNTNNCGVGISRNKGIKKAKGKYIIFVDSDDGLFKNSLINLENSIKNKPNPDVVIVHFEKITYPTSNSKLLNANIRNNNNSSKLINYIKKTKFPFADCWFFVTKKKFLIDNKIFFPKIRFGESELFVVKIISLMKRYNCMKDIFYDKKDRDSSLNHSKDYNATLSTLILILDFCLFLNTYKLSKIKKDFALTYIQDALGIFTSLLILRNKKELQKLANKISKERNNLTFLKKMPENLYFHKYFNIKNPSIGLIKYKNEIIDYHFKSLRPFLNQYKYIFCYCRSKYSESTAHFLKDYNIKINGIIDDNLKFKNTIFLNFKTINSSFFVKKYKEKINEYGIIINHQRESTSKKILKSLIDQGLSRKQIKIIKF